MTEARVRSAQACSLSLPHTQPRRQREILGLRESHRGHQNSRRHRGGAGRHARPFDEDDSSYFEPLMAQTEARLGRKPRFGAWDTAFGAQYVYQYFHDAGGFAEAAVRVSEVAACCGCA